MTEALLPASELLERHIDQFNDTHLLIAGQLLDDYPVTLAKRAQQATLCVTHAGMAKRYQAQSGDNTQIKLAAEPLLTGAYDTLLLYIPKAKQEADYWLNLLLPQLQTDADIFIVGENRGGINSAIKLLKGYDLQGRKVDSARRCSLIYAARDKHELTYDPQDWQQRFTLSLPQGELTICSRAGVFNHGKLDQGTRLLLEHLPHLTGKGLDFGCGAGIIAAAISHQSGASMTALDVSALATQATSETFAANKLTGEIICADNIAALDNQQFDFIVSNPPFHLGVKTQYDTSFEFIQQARHKLKSSGQLWLVANAFLPYQALLETHFKNVQVVADDHKFKLYRCLN